MIFLKLIPLGIIIYVPSDQQASSKANSKKSQQLEQSKHQGVFEFNQFGRDLHSGIKGTAVSLLT